MTTLIKPADLDTSKPISRSEYRQWQYDMSDYYALLRAEEKRLAKLAEAEAAAPNQPLTEADYDKEVVEQYEAAQARLAAAAAAEQAEQEAKAAYLSSMPEVAEVFERSEYMLLVRLQHWLQLGYTVTEESIQGFFPGYYFIELTKPAPAAAKKAK